MRTSDQRSLKLQHCWKPGLVAHTEDNTSVQKSKKVIGPSWSRVSTGLSTDSHWIPEVQPKKGCPILTSTVMKDLLQALPTERPWCGAVVIGAGFAGMYMLYKLRTLGVTAKAFEAGGDVGGTWYWNRYPGARCDIPSMQYSYQFSEELQQEWHWMEKYAGQPEILQYINHVAERFDLRKDIQFDTRVVRATWDEVAKKWIVETDRGDRVSARFCILATGCLSSQNVPQLAGLVDFRGKWYHTGQWPHEGVDFTGSRVGVIGTGSTGIQIIPMIAKEAEHLYVFQRTPQYSIPMHNAPLDPEEEARIKADYQGFRARNHRNPGCLETIQTTVNTFDVTDDERQRHYEERWRKGGLNILKSAYADSTTSRDADRTISDFIKNKIRLIVKDPSVAALLMPVNIYGCKRPILDTNYFETYNHPNVTLVDVRRSGIERVTSRGLLANGDEYLVDCIVFATGYDAITGSINQIDIRGRHQVALADKWAGGPRNYLGLCSAGFPNLFTITGPFSPSVLANMIPAIEQHVDWIGDLVTFMSRRGKETVEATEEAKNAWVARVWDVASATLWPACNNWYLGANIPGKPRMFMPYANWVDYNDQCEQVVRRSYEGFSLQ